MFESVVYMWMFKMFGFFLVIFVLAYVVMHTFMSDKLRKEMLETTAIILPIVSISIALLAISFTFKPPPHLERDEYANRTTDLLLSEIGVMLFDIKSILENSHSHQHIIDQDLVLKNKDEMEKKEKEGLYVFRPLDYN